MRDPATKPSPRFAVSIVGKKRGAEGRLLHELTIVDAADAAAPDDAGKFAVRAFVKSNPAYDVAGWLCEAIRHG